MEKYLSLWALSEWGREVLESVGMECMGQRSTLVCGDGVIGAEKYLSLLAWSEWGREVPEFVGME